MKTRFLLLLLVPVLVTAVMLMLFPLGLEPLRTAATAEIDIGSGVLLYLDENGVVLRVRTEEKPLRRAKLPGCSFEEAVARVLETACAEAGADVIRQATVRICVKDAFRETQATGQSFRKHSLSLSGRNLSLSCSVKVLVMDISPFLKRSARYTAVFAPGGTFGKETWIGDSSLRAAAQ